MKQRIKLCLEKMSNSNKNYLRYYQCLKFLILIARCVVIMNPSITRYRISFPLHDECLTRQKHLKVDTSSKVPVHGINH